MTYRFIYNNFDCQRVIPAILIDSRSNIPAIKNKIGSAIKAYTDAETSKVTGTVIFYKIETELGVLAGYFSLQTATNGTATILQYQIRPSFAQFNTEIQGLINTFIQANEYGKDYLF